MRDVIQKWYDWLKQACPKPAEVATSTEKEALSHVVSDGRQLWATDGYSLHARQVATGKEGHVALDEAGLFQVSAAAALPDLAGSLPQGEPVAWVVVERERLLLALTGQDRHVRLAFYAPDRALALASAGAYALVMPVTGMEEDDFWRPALAEQ